MSWPQPSISLFNYLSHTIIKLVYALLIFVCSQLDGRLLTLSYIIEVCSDFGVLDIVCCLFHICCAKIAIILESSMVLSTDSVQYSR